MTFLVVFLSVTNIAIGYGLAVYLRRAALAYEPVPEIPPAPAPELPAQPVATPVASAPAQPVVAPAPVEATTPAPIEAAVPTPEAPEVPVQPPLAVEQTAAAVATTSAAADELPNEENVLAGIEAFRSQLAKLNQSEAAEPEAELAEATA